LMWQDLSPGAPAPSCLRRCRGNARVESTGSSTLSASSLPGAILVQNSSDLSELSGRCVPWSRSPSHGQWQLWSASWRAPVSAMRRSSAFLGLASGGPLRAGHRPSGQSQPACGGRPLSRRTGI
jgi:hypothetical protein